MRVKIINYCKKSYKIHPEELIHHILEKIPDKFLMNLTEIRIFDTRKNPDFPHVKYIEPTKSSQGASIEIFMDDPTFHLFPFFSILSFNTSFLEGINVHIEKYVKLHSQDKEIMSKDPLRFKYEWMSFGAWYPLFWVLFIIPHYLVSKSRLCRQIAFYIGNLVIKKVKKMMSANKEH